PARRHKIEDLSVMLCGAIAALGRVGLMLNVRKTNLPAVLGLLPALKNPTVAPLADGEWVAVNTIIEEQTAWSLIPKLKEANAQGIVEYPLNKGVMGCAFGFLTGVRRIDSCRRWNSAVRPI